MVKVLSCELLKNFREYGAENENHTSSSGIWLNILMGITDIQQHLFTVWYFMQGYMRNFFILFLKIECSPLSKLIIYCPLWFINLVFALVVCDVINKYAMGDFLMLSQGA